MSSPLVSLITSLLRSDHFSENQLPGITLLQCYRSIARTPILYNQPGIVLIAQGRKVGYLGDKEIHYNPGQYLVQTLPLPFECETFASAQEPLLGLVVRIEPVLLMELVHDMGAVATKAEPSPLASVAMTDAMFEAAERLLKTLRSPQETRVMGASRVRELIYEALKGEQGSALRAMVQGQGHYARITQVLSQMRENIEQDITVEHLARGANMSVSTFHQHFKDVALCSPLQYLKRLRLLKAQLLLTQDRYNVGQAAMAVGYKSVNQFSRDYKRYFGLTANAERQSA